MTKQVRIVLILFAALNCTHILDFMILMPLGNYLMPYFNIGPNEFSVLVSSYAISAGVSSFLAAFFVNKFDRKKVLIFGYTGFLIGTLACGIVNSYELLLTARIISGLFGGMIFAQIISVISDLIEFENRGKAMGIVMSSFAITSTLGVPFSLYISNLYNWHAPFLLAGGLGIIILPLLFKFLPSLTSHIGKEEVNKWEVLSQVLKDKPQYLSLIFSSLMMMGHFLIIPFLNPFMEFNLGYDKATTPLIYLFGGASAFVSSFTLGKLADKYGKFKVYVFTVLCSLPCVLTITHLQPINFSYVLVIIVFWFYMSTGRAISAQALISNVGKQEYRGSFQSFNSFMQQMGIGIASLISGLIIYEDENHALHNYNILGYISVAILIFTIIVGLLIFKGDKVKE